MPTYQPLPDANEALNIIGTGRVRPTWYRFFGDLLRRISAIAGDSYAAKAWVVFNGTTNVGGFCTILDSYNVTSVADNGTGDHTINFTTPFGSANYAFSINPTDSAGSAAIGVAKAAPTASAFRVSTINSVFAPTDYGRVSAVFFGDQ